MKETKKIDTPFLADFKARLAILNRNLGRFKCSRCGKEGHIDYPPKELQREWGIISWTAFLAMYMKWHLHWYILKGWAGEFICPDCLLPGDDIDDRKLSCTDDWIKKYNEWKSQNDKK